MMSSLLDDLDRKIFDYVINFSSFFDEIDHRLALSLYRKCKLFLWIVLDFQARIGRKVHGFFRLSSPCT